MIFLFFLITYINLFIVQGSINSATETNDRSLNEKTYKIDQKKYQSDIDSDSDYNYPELNLYPRNVGIKNEAYNCYMNSIFACLYNIPFFQSAVYRFVNKMTEFPSKTESTLMALADIFAKMRLGKEPIEISTTMFLALKHQMNWNVGSYECVLEFWERFAQTLPESVQTEFKIKTKLNFIRKSDGLLIKSVFDESYVMILPLPEHQERMSAILEKQFIDKNPEDYIINPEDQGEYNFIDVPITEKIRIPIYNTITIENTPNIFIFGLKRLGMDIKNGSQIFNGTKIVFDQIKIKDEVYCPIGGVIFDHILSHYFALNIDFGSSKFFIHNDSNIYHEKFPISENLLNIFKSNTVLIFYAKVSAWERISADLKQQVLVKTDIPLSLLFETQKESVNSEVKEFFENSLSEYTDILSYNECSSSTNIETIGSNILIDKKNDQEQEVDLNSTLQKNTNDVGCNNNNNSPINSQIASKKSKILPVKVKNEIKNLEFQEFSFCRKRTRLQEAKAQAQKNSQVESEILEQVLIQAQKLESETIEQLKIRLKEFLAPIFAPIKLKFKNLKYELGTKNFTFDRLTETEYESFALELVLSTFASNSSFLKNLFDSLLDSSETKSLKYATAVVLIQMTTGGQEIDLIDLIKIIKNIENFSFLDSEEGRHDEKVLLCFKFFCKHLDRSLIQIPQVKTIELRAGIELNEPKNCDNFILESSKSIPSLLNFESSVSGIISDKNENGIVNRSILNASSIIFPIFIDRRVVLNNNTWFFKGDIHLNFLDDYLISGAIIYDKNAVNGLSSFLNQNFQKNLYLRYSKQLEGKIFKIFSASQHAETQLRMLEYFRQYSLVIICSKSSLWNLNEAIKLEDIPSHLIKNALKKTYFNLIRKSKFFKDYIKNLKIK